jgi:hypothetical protein
MTPDQPAHPLHALTTYELQNYRRDLEHALTATPENAAARGLLNEKLAGVQAEQDSRAAIAATLGR